MTGEKVILSTRKHQARERYLRLIHLPDKSCQDFNGVYAVQRCRDDGTWGEKYLFSADGTEAVDCSCDARQSDKRIPCLHMLAWQFFLFNEYEDESGVVQIDESQWLIKPENNTNE